MDLDILKPLKSRNYRNFFFSQLISDIGNWFDYTALLIIMAYKWGLGAESLALYTFAVGLPWIVVSPIAGIIVDKLKTRNILLMTDMIRGFLVFSFIFIDNFYVLLSIVFLKSCIGTFFEPARQIAIKTLVPDTYLFQANSLNQFSIHSSKIIGPAFGSLILNYLGTEILFIIDSLSFFIASLIISLFIKFPSTKKLSTKRKHVKIHKEIIFGFSFIKSNPTLKSLLLLNVFVFFNIFLFDSLGILLSKKMGFSETIFGFFITFVALGSVLGAGIVNQLEKKITFSKLILYSSICLSIMVVVTGLGGLGLLTTWLPFWFFVWFIIGICMSLIYIYYGYILQKTTPSNILGKVSSAGNALINLSMVISPIIGAFLSQIIGISGVFILSGTLILIVSMIINKNHFRKQHIIKSQSSI